MALGNPLGGWAPLVARLFAAFEIQAGEPDARIQKICVWLELVTSWNERIQLTAARSHEELVDLLLADAAAVIGARAPAPLERWVDVGSGVGAPGIALALLAPLTMTLVEPREKRVAFLRTCIGALARPDVSVQRCRSEGLPAEFAHTAISRATLEPAAWLKEGLRLATDGAWVLLARSEPPSLPGCRVAMDVEYVWPLTQARRRAVYLTRENSPQDEK